MNNDYILDKRRLRHSFERAAAGYDQAAVLQREVCERMLSRLDYIKIAPTVILDAGSGTGYGSRKLAMRYPVAKMLAIDIASAMHLQARTAIVVPWWQRLLPLPLSMRRSHAAYVCGDIEALPLKNSCIGMVWSNLALQWCNDLERAFAEAHRVLQDGGLFMFSTFGPDTLKELRQAFEGDNHNHTNRFTDMHDIGDMLVQSGFATPVMDMETITLTYDDVIGVMRDLKAIGAHNVTQGRQRGLTGKHAWQKAMSRYEALRTEGKLPASFEVVYGHAWKPQSSPVRKMPDGKQIINIGRT